MVSNASADFVDQLIVQNTVNGPSPAQGAVGGAIAGAIIAFDAQGFKFHPILPAENALSLGAWLRSSE